MAQNLLFEKLEQGAVALGIANTYPASGIIEGMCRGWDFVWIDGQHGEHSYESILHALQAALAVHVDALVRVLGHDRSMLGVYADLAPQAVMVPMVNTAGEAREIVRGLYFAPLGSRSYGGRRVIDLHTRDYYTQTRILVVVQIETLEAIDNAPQIAALEGIHVLFFGPDDVKVQLGIPINTPLTESRELREGMGKTARAARNAGKFAGCVVGDAEGLEMALSMGYQLIVGGGDVAFLRTRSAERLAEFRKIVGG